MDTTEIDKRERRRFFETLSAVLLIVAMVWTTIL